MKTLFWVRDCGGLGLEWGMERTIYNKGGKNVVYESNDNCLTD